MEKHCKRRKQWGVPHTSHNTNKCRKYNKQGNLVARTGGNGGEQGGGGQDFPPTKSWEKERHSFMTSMKTMEKTMAKLTKKVVKAKTKPSCKCSHYESKSSGSDSK